MNLLHALIAALGPKVVGYGLMALGLGGIALALWIRARMRRRAFEVGRADVIEASRDRKRIAVEREDADAKAERDAARAQSEDSTAVLDAELDRLKQMKDRDVAPDAKSGIAKWRGKGGVR